jgi:ribonuclease inhibitor
MNAKKAKIIFIDGENIETEIALHKYLKQELNLPDYYGMNLHALWDCITGYIELPVKIIWNNFDLSKKKLGDKFVGYVIDLFKRAQKELPGEFDYELK